MVGGPEDDGCQSKSEHETPPSVETSTKMISAEPRVKLTIVPKKKTASKHKTTSIADANVNSKRKRVETEDVVEAENKLREEKERRPNCRCSGIIRKFNSNGC